MRVGTIIIGFILVGAILIVINNNIDMSEKTGQKEFFSSFIDWIKQVGKNTVNLVGHVISDYDWMPDKTSDARSDANSDRISEDINSSTENKTQRLVGR